MSGGGGRTVQTSQGGPTQSQSTFQPHPSTLPGYGFLAGQAPLLMQQPIPFFPGPTYVGPSAATQQGVNLGMEAVNTWMPEVLGTARQNYGQLSTAADVANNPYVQAMNSMTQRNLTQNLQENILPGLSSGASAVNALGSGRLGLAQGRAVGDTQKAIADAMTQTNLGAYGQGLGAQQAALQGTGAMLQNLTAPSQTALSLGGTAEDYQGRALQDAMSRFAYQYQEPYTRMQNLAQTLGYLQPLGTTAGSGYSSAIGTQPNPNYQSGMQTAAGLGSLALAAAMFFSDRRLKRNIRRIGTTPGGIPWYEFEYIWGEPGEGVMSDEVPKDVVVRHSSGFDMVDYRRVF